MGIFDDPLPITHYPLPFPLGITIVQKSNLSRPNKKSKIALVLAGGAITGAAFKIGGLKALNDCLVGRKLTQFDIYVGVSAGAVLSIPLCSDIDPAEMLASLSGKSKRFSQLAPYEFYKPNLLEFAYRPAKYFYGQLMYFPRALGDLVTASKHKKLHVWEHLRDFLKNPSLAAYEELAAPIWKTAFGNRRIPGFEEFLPSGIFDNKPIEKYLRRNMEHNGMPNNFRQLKKETGKSLYITAVDLDTSKLAIFGPDEINTVTISEAAQASGALPGFYKPARIRGVDYIDGGVHNTADIKLAFDKGADLVICYNPFRPYNNKIFLEFLEDEKKFITKKKRLSNWGMATVLHQVFRTLFHCRLEAELENLRKDPKFKKDIILIQPTEDDSDFFAMNPIFFWKRGEAAKLGFDSVTQSLSRHHAAVAKVLKAHGMGIS